MDAASLLSFSAKSAAAGESLWLAIVRFDGADMFSAAITEPRGMPSLVLGGEIDQGELSVRIRKEVMPDRPSLEKKLEWKRPSENTWRVKVWRITEVISNDCDAVWLIKCEPWN